MSDTEREVTVEIVTADDVEFATSMEEENEQEARRDEPAEEYDYVGDDFNFDATREGRGYR